MSAGLCALDIATWNPLNVGCKGCALVALTNRAFNLTETVQRNLFHTSTDIRRLFHAWNRWCEHPNSRESMQEFLDRGTLTNMTDEFARMLRRAISTLIRRKDWGSTFRLRVLALRQLCLRKFISSFSVVLEELQPPGTREEIRLLYVRYFQRVRERYSENLEKKEKKWLNQLRKNLLQGAYSHSKSVHPYNDLDMDHDAALFQFEKFCSPRGIDESAMAEVTFPFRNYCATENHTVFKGYQRRLDGFRALHGDIIGSEARGREWLAFLSCMDLDISRETLKGPRPVPNEVMQGKSAVESVEAFVEMRGGLAKGKLWKEVSKQKEVLGDFGTLLEHAMDLAVKNNAVIQQMDRPTPFIPSYPANTPMSDRSPSPLPINEVGTRFDKLMARVSPHTERLGEMYGNWTLSDDMRSKGRNNDGAKVVTGAFHSICWGVCMVGSTLSSMDMLHRWLAGLEDWECEDLAQSFALWLANVCRPGSKEHLISYDAWFDERLEKMSRDLWEVLGEVAEALNLSGEDRSRFVFLTVSQLVGSNCMRRFVTKLEDLNVAFLQDLDTSRWGPWRNEYVGVISARPNKKCEVVLKRLRIHGLFFLVSSSHILPVRVCSLGAR